jgi:hypothetical protein
MADFPIEENAGDHAHRIARSALSFLPLVGDTAVEILNYIISTPLEKRRNAWFQSLGEKVLKLERSGKVDVDELKQNELFVTIVMQATQAAIRSHEDEKLEALRNAVSNTALNCSIDESIQQMFIRFVDEFTPWHIRLLKLLQNPHAWFLSNNKRPPSMSIGGSKMQMIKTAFPELQVEAFVEQMARDFNGRGLAGEGLKTMMTGSGVMAPSTTELGNRFVSYITEKT